MLEFDLCFFCKGGVVRPGRDRCDRCHEKLIGGTTHAV